MTNKTQTTIKTTTVATKNNSNIVTGAVGTGYTMAFKGESTTPWYGRCDNCRSNTALVFIGNENTKFKTIHACACGYRKFFSVTTEEDLIPVEKARVTCKCGTVLPKGRKQYCHTCRKPTTTVKAVNDQEVASTASPINM
jgi:hypothetical protein